MPEKIDLKKELKHLYGTSSRGPVMVDVPAMNYLMIDGQGDPNTSQHYMDVVEALFALSYGLKFAIKKASGVDYSVMPLEGLWWTEGPGFDVDNRDSWMWTAMIMQPRFVSAGILEMTIPDVQKKKDPSALPMVRFEAFAEGLCAQVTHVGPYSEEGPTIKALHKFIAEQGLMLIGKHHEIYLGDPRRSAPEKLKTIIRQPVSNR